MVEIVVSVVTTVSEFLVDPAVRQLGYLFKYRTNIEDLSQKVEKLRDVRARQQHSVDEAIRNGHIIEHDVCKWLTRADGFIQDAANFLEDYEKVAARKSTTCCFNIGLCRPNLKSRHRLSRRAKKKAGVAAQLIHEVGLQFERPVSYRVPLQQIRSSAPSSSEALQSRMMALNEVMEALKDANINKIGVCGPGGVGKSTLVKQAAEEAEQNKLFQMVILASVLHTPDFKRIQGELGDKLGLKFEEESEQGRAARLQRRIMEEKTILIILDDLWAELELDKIGIPSPVDLHKGCKLLLTSRYKDVLSNKMGTQKDFQLKHLQQEESWILFKNRAGDSIELEPDLRPIAMEVAKECAGLPIALATVATALKNKSLSTWKDARRQLKARTLTNISGMESKVYSSLKMSYDYLEGDDVKSFFLLCGLFSNYIHIRDWLKYGVGLQLFEGTNTLEEARDSIGALVERLQSSNLLLDTGDKEIVRMHDVIQNVALEIASKEHHESTFEKGGGWSKVNHELKKFTMRDVDVSELPPDLVCPKLELFMCCLNTRSAVLEIPDTFFEGMEQLKVLDFTGMHLPSLPSSLQCLANLRTLCLDQCKVGDIAIITELKQLEILSLMNSDIEQLPREIAGLTLLRLLDLKGSSKLQVIPPHAISSLTRLEDLGMGNSFTKWEMEGKSNASLAELKHLSRLTSLDIQIPDAKLLPKDFINVFDNLVRYKIFVGGFWRWEESYKMNRTLKVKFGTSLHLVDGINKFLKRTEDLCLRELCGGTNALSKLDGGEGFPQLKHLTVESSPEIRCILNSIDLITPSSQGGGAFPVMETLCLYQLVNLQEVCYGQLPAGSFSRLKKVDVEDCDGLKYLFLLSVARSLSKLEEIEVTGCKNMIEMVSNSQGRCWKEIKEDAAANDVLILFPELRHLTLQDLPKLRNICFEEEEEEEKPVLSNQLEISDNSQLLLSLGGNLRFLQLQRCMSLLKLFPLSLLQNLEELVVERCDQLEQVFDLEGLNVDDHGHVGCLPKLQKLSLIGLPKLRHICNWGTTSSTTHHFSSSSTASDPAAGNIIFPKLTRISLESLPALTSFSSIGYHSLQRFHHPDLDTSLPVLFAETAAFPCLEFLNISGLDNMTKIWENQLPDEEESFSKLKVVRVTSCGEVLNIFPSSILERLQSLRYLRVKNCSSLEEVFDVNVNANAKKEGATVTQLSELILESLPKVDKIWNKDPHGILSFQNIKSIYVKGCESLKNLFPASLVGDLGQLEKLNVSSSGIEEIVAKDNGGVDVEKSPTFVFPKLTTLLLNKLPQLRSLYPGAHTSQWPFLEKLDVWQCHKLNLSAFGTPTFEQRQVVAIPCLEESRLGHNSINTEIWQEQFLMNSFPRLRVLDVRRNGDGISVVIPSFALQGLHNLEKLYVIGCSSVKEVFQLEGLDDEQHHQAKPLRRLREIWLDDLPQLTHLWKENNKPAGLDLQSLEGLQVLNCESLINLVPSSTSFQNLVTLDVSSCGSLRSLISPLVAKTLVKLKTLIIGESLMMEEIVANEGGEAIDEITFYELQHMELSELPNLTGFSTSGGYTFSFPSLEHMEVHGCPNMKIFSPSLVTTPKLKCIKVEDNDGHWQDDLNTTIQSLFLNTHDNVEVESVELLHGS